MKREFICIICPIGCQISVEYEGKKIIDIKGAQCSKGEDYAKNEICNPLRVFTGSIKVTKGDFKQVSVKSSSPIPKKYLKKIGKITHSLELKAPVKIGQIITFNLLNKKIDLVATRKIKRKTIYSKGMENE